LSSRRTPQCSSTPQHNLPAPRSSFVGREREIEEVKRELAMTRLLSPTGVGGSGKTRRHLGLIYRKLGLHSRTEAVRFASDHGLL
jgi:hypothetical protein